MEDRRAEKWNRPAFWWDYLSPWIQLCLKVVSLWPSWLYEWIIFPFHLHNFFLLQVFFFFFFLSFATKHTFTNKICLSPEVAQIPVKFQGQGVLLFSHVWLFATPWTVACQASLSMGFPSQEHWSGLLFPSPGDLPDSGIKPRSPALQADSLLSASLGKICQKS